jgi:hypothetical protein
MHNIVPISVHLHVCSTRYVPYMHTTNCAVRDSPHLRCICDSVACLCFISVRLLVRCLAKLRMHRVPMLLITHHIVYAHVCQQRYYYL